jgi:hypothetical protein
MKQVKILAHMGFLFVLSLLKIFAKRDSLLLIVDIIDIPSLVTLQ